VPTRKPQSSSPPYRILCQGRWLPEQVEIDFNQQFYVLPESHAKRSYVFWQKIIADGRKLLFNGELFRLEGQVATPKLLRLTLSSTCYRDQIYSNVHIDDLLKSHGARAPARALGVSALLITADGFTPIIRRSDHLGEEPGKLDVVGGHAHPDQHLKSGQPDFFRAIHEEVAAELNLNPSRFVASYCCGLVENARTRKPELVFLINLRESFEEMCSAASKAPEADEIVEILPAKATRSGLSEVTAKNQSNFTPVGLGCLKLLHASLPERTADK